MSISIKIEVECDEWNCTRILNTAADAELTSLDGKITLAFYPKELYDWQRFAPYYNHHTEYYCPEHARKMT